jgi:signal transduction histidine kinase
VSTAARTSLAGRLTWLAAGLSLATFIIMGATLTVFFRNNAIRRLDDSLAATVEELGARADIDGGGKLQAPALNRDKTQRLYSGDYWEIAQLDPKGKLEPLARSKSLFESELAAPGADASVLKTVGRQLYYDAKGPLGDPEPLRITAQTVTLPGRTAPLVFMAGVNRRPSDRDVARSTTLTWIILVVLGAGLVAAIVVQVRVGLRPLFELEREIADARKGKVQRLSGDYPKEIAPLAQELNALLDHNREVVERQRSHVGNLAHALKTPIAVMLSEAERRASGVADPGAEPLDAVVKRQTEAMRDHVEHHLRRARAAARAQNLGERTPVEPVLDELASLLERVFHEKAVSIDWRAPETLEFRGERQDLQEVAGNILENACKWCNVRVRATAEPIDGTGNFRLVVEDDGPGLPEDRRDEVLKRGARLDESAPGSGLGLSIVDELSRAYGGRVALDRSALGGLRVEVVLPAAEG